VCDILYLDEPDILPLEYDYEERQWREVSAGNEEVDNVVENIIDGVDDNIEDPQPSDLFFLDPV
tara:strand:- start:26 stop:217 length:192 start_codon:yes stop_codon:yes gene_type:complete